MGETEQHAAQPEWDDNGIELSEMLAPALARAPQPQAWSVSFC